jgi:hypothetical protein
VNSSIDLSDERETGKLFRSLFPKDQAGNNFPGGMLSVLREHGLEPRFLMLTEYREHATRTFEKPGTYSRPVP